MPTQGGAGGVLVSSADVAYQPEVRKESDRFAADDMALNAGMPATTYGAIGVYRRSNCRRMAASGTGDGPPRQLSRRIGLLLDPRRNRRPLGQRLSALVTVGESGEKKEGRRGQCQQHQKRRPRSRLREKVEAQKSKPKETIRQQIERKLQATIDVDFSDAARTELAKYFGKQLEVNLITMKQH